MTRGYADVSCGQLHYSQSGNGKPLVLLHQTRISGEEYSEVMPYLALSYRAIALDLPGHGYSDSPGPGFTIEDHARTIIEFMDAEGLDNVGLVGHHVGARIAAQVAASWPQRVEKLVLSGCPWYTREERQSLRENPNYRHLEAGTDTSFIIELWERYRSNFKEESTPQRLCKVVVATLITFVKDYDIHKAVFNHDIEPCLKALQCPTLLVSGDKDVFYRKMEATAQLIKDCRTHVIAGGGYFGLLEKAREYSDAITGFIG